MRWISGTLMLMLMFVVAGCGSPTSPKAVLPKSAATDQILVSSQPLLEMAQAVAAETLPVAKIVSDSVSSRYWKPTREEARTLQQARLILINGAGYEPWTARLSLPDSRLIDTAAGYYDQLVRIPDAVTHQHGPGGKHGHPGTVWATWLNPELASSQLSQVTSALTKVSPDQKTKLEANAARMKSQLESVNQRVSELQTLTGEMKLTILSDGPFYQYLTERLGWKLNYMHWSETGELSDIDQQELTTAMKDLPADHHRLFLISSRQSEQAETFAADLGLRVVRVDLCEFPATPASTLIERLEGNLTRLKNAVTDGH